MLGIQRSGRFGTYSLDNEGFLHTYLLSNKPGSLCTFVLFYDLQSGVRVGIVRLMRLRAAAGAGQSARRRRRTARDPQQYWPGTYVLEQPDGFAVCQAGRAAPVH